MKFVHGARHEQNKWLNFGRNWDRNKGAGYDSIIFESKSTSFTAMSNRNGADA